MTWKNILKIRTTKTEIRNLEDLFRIYQYLGILVKKAKTIEDLKEKPHLERIPEMKNRHTFGNMDYLTYLTFPYIELKGNTPEEKMETLREMEKTNDLGEQLKKLFHDASMKVKEEIDRMTGE